jgi:hypothetical protein
MAEIQIKVSKEGPAPFKMFKLRATEIVTNLLPYFDEEKVFLKTYLKSDKENLPPEIFN